MNMLDCACKVHDYVIPGDFLARILLPCMQLHTLFVDLPVSFADADLEPLLLHNLPQLKILSLKRKHNHSYPDLINGDCITKYVDNCLHRAQCASVTIDGNIVTPPLSKLEEIYLDGRSIHKVAFFALTRLPSIKKVSVVDCKYITQLDVDTFKNLRPDIELISNF